MKLRIYKDITIYGINPELKNYLQEYLVTENPEYIEARKFGRYLGNIQQWIVQFQEENDGGFTIPRGMLEHVLIDLGLEFQVEDARVGPEAEKTWPIPNAVLRPDDQEPAVQEILSHYNGFLSAPAGSGKTVMGLMAAQRLGLKCLWLTHRQELKDQVIDEIVEHLDIPRKSIGIIHGKTWRIGEQITIGMIPTLKNRDLSPLVEEFGVIIIDEAHHVPSKTFLQVVNNFAARYIYALTATPKRRDKLEAIMFNAIGPILHRIEHQVLEDEGHLMKPTIRRRKTGWLPPDAHLMEYHDFMEQMVHDVGRNSRIVDDIISECRPGNTSIALVGRTKHAEVLTDMLKKKGIKAEFCVATIDVEDASGKKKKKKKAIPKAIRDQIVADFKEGKLEVLVATYDLLAEGFNYKPLNRLFMASPIKWEGWVEQALGRIRRPSEGKTDAIAYDYVDEQIAMFIKQAEVRYQSVYKVMGMPVEET